MKNLTIFDKTGSFENLYNQTEQVLSVLAHFGFSKNESKIYTFLGKYGTKSASEIKINLNISHTQVYRILNKLQTNGILDVSYSPTTLYSIISPKNLLRSFIQEKKNEIKILEKNEKIFLELWSKIPNFVGESTKPTSNVFQILNGSVQINNKLKVMIKGSKKELLLLGSQKDFARFHYNGIFDLLKKSKINQKLLGEKFEDLKEIFKSMHKENIQIISRQEKIKLCFAIVDGCDVILFTKQTNNKKSTAIFTNSSSILDSLSLLFDLLWSYGPESKKEFATNEKITDTEFILREEKQLIIINNEIKQFLKNKKQNEK